MPTTRSSGGRSDLSDRQGVRAAQVFHAKPQPVLTREQLLEAAWDIGFDTNGIGFVLALQTRDA